MALGNGTMIVAGRQIAVPNTQAYNPKVYAPNVGSAPAVGAQVPSPLTNSGSSSGLSHQAIIAQANPWSFKDSPLPWAIIGLFGSLMLLKWIHWPSRSVKQEVAE